MHIQVEITAEDCIEYNHYYIWTRPERKEHRTVYALLPFCGAFLLILFTRGINVQLYGAPELLLFLFSTILALYIPKGVKQQTARLIHRLVNEGKSETVLGKRIISIEPGKLTEAHNFFRLELSWPAFEKIAETKDYFFLIHFINQAIVIPKRFLSAAEVEQVRALLADYVNNKTDVNSPELSLASS